MMGRTPTPEMFGLLIERGMIERAPGRKQRRAIGTLARQDELAAGTMVSGLGARRRRRLLARLTPKAATPPQLEQALERAALEGGAPDEVYGLEDRR